MKPNQNSIIRPLSASIAGLLLIAGLNNSAMADNAAAFKDAIGTKVADAKNTNMKETGSFEKLATDNFKSLDANGDGKVSVKEAVKDKSLAEQFDAADINHDGMLSTDEYAGFLEASAGKVSDAASGTTTN
jgi:hypothetical protein